MFQGLRQICCYRQCMPLGRKRVEQQATLWLPKAFSCKIIPEKRSHFPRPESALQWRHLEKIAAQIAPYHNDVDIGSDCPCAIMPREIIPGEDDNRYVLSSDLGWGIIGKISQPLSGEDGDEVEIGVIGCLTFIKSMISSLHLSAFSWSFWTVHHCPTASTATCIPLCPPL